MQKMHIPALIERVRVLTGPDREVDAAIYNLLVDDGGRVAFKVQNYATPPGDRLDRWHDGWLVGKGSDDQYAEDLPRFTASVDADIGLATMVLPGWGFYLRSDKEGNGCGMVYPDAFRVTPEHCMGPTPAIALVLAILTALQSEGQP